MDAKVKNYAPDADKVVVSVGEYEVTIERDENGQVYICIEDVPEGSETRLVLGQPGETQRV
jgi:hypothetical protein